MGKLVQLPCLESIHLSCRLKTINLVIRSTQGAEGLVQSYEEQLKDVQAVPSDLKAVEATKAELKVTSQTQSCRGGGDLWAACGSERLARP